MINNKYIKDSLKDLSPYVPSLPSKGIFLDANESPFNLPADIIASFSAKLATIDFNRYPDSDCRELKTNLAKFYGLSVNNICVGVGSDDLIDIIFKATITDKKLLTLYPTFSMYSIYCKLNGGREVSVKGDSNFKHNVPDIITALKREKPLLAIICNPNNPTGELFSREELIQIIESTDSLIMVDEAYAEFSGITVSDLVNKYDNLIVLRTFSKAYSFASARLGYMLTNKSIAGMIEAVKSPYRVNSVNLVLGSIIISNSKLYQDNINYLRAEVKTVYTELKKIEGLNVLSTGSNFLMFESEVGLVTELANNGIKVRNFTFEGKYFIRMSVGLREQNALFLEIVRKYYANK